MAVFNLLTVLFCVLAVMLYAGAAFILLKKKTGGSIPIYSLLFAGLSFLFLISAALSCLFSAYTVFLPVTLFLSAVCFALHFATEKEAFPVELSSSGLRGFEDSSAAEPEAQAGQAFAWEQPKAAPIQPAPVEESVPAALSRDGLTAEEMESLLEAAQGFIGQVSQSITEDSSLEGLLAFANKLLIRNTGADGGIILLVDDYEDILNAKALSGQFPPPYMLPNDVPRKQSAVEASLKHARIPFAGNILGDAALSGEALYIKDGMEDPRVYVNGAEDFLKPGSYIIAPLYIKNEVEGVAALARLSKSEPFSEKDFKAAKVLASYTAASVNVAYSLQEIMEHTEIEIGAEIAAKMQKNFLPRQLPDLPEIEFGFFSLPAKGVCSDYCDVIFARRDRIALVMADIAGKGIIAGMVTIGLRAILHLVTNTTKNAATIMGWVNKVVTAEKNIHNIDHFAALSYISYSLETRELEYSNAGQQPMLLWRYASKRIYPVYIDSDPVGIDRNTEYKEIKLTAMPGDIIILLTDGILETLNEQGLHYGYAHGEADNAQSILSAVARNKLVPPRLSKVVSENAASSARDIARAIKNDLNDFMGSAARHDDQSLLVMKIKG